MIDNNKSIKDTYMSNETIENINNQVQMKEVMLIKRQDVMHLNQ